MVRAATEMSANRGSPSWTRYRERLDARFGIRVELEPEESFVCLRGHEIHLDEWRPEGNERGVLILVHGAGGNGRILAPLAVQAAREGWRVLAPDLPGYGLTRPAAGFNWDYAEWPRVVADLADEQASPVVLLGASVGGLTAVHAARLSEKVRAVAATTLVDMGDPGTFVRAARWPWLGALALAGFSVVPWLADRIALPLRWTAPLRRMSSDAELQHYFDTDALIGAARIPARFFRTLHAVKVGRICLRCPLILIHPGADAWTPTAWSLDVLARIEGETAFVALDTGSHLPLESPAAAQLQAALFRFLDRFAPREG
ncbi:MAG: hypothetical protein RL588_1706 [Pseudomonadota bacterium]|jgi:pimeloyl-ACP methyl ester carboxylesterase